MIGFLIIKKKLRENNKVKFSIFYEREFFIKKILKVILHKLKFKTQLNNGPAQVVLNLIESLRKNRITFNINPVFEKDIAKTCIVLSGKKKLQRCIYLKKKKIILHLIAGPNLVVTPNEFNYILFSKEIDKIIVPSIWVKNLYKKLGIASEKIFIWFSGVNIFTNKNKKKDQILVYIKNNNKLIKPCLNYLKKRDYNFKIIRYGFYAKEHYYNMLHCSTLMIYFGSTESQGIAMQEAWSMNVPTLVLRNEYFFYNKKKYLGSSSPYLTSSCGFLFKNFKQFTSKFNFIISSRLYPRNWIMKNMSQKKSLNKLLYIIKK